MLASLLPDKSARPAGAPVAWLPLGIVASATAVLLAAFGGRYGYHRDELYYVVAGRHLAWGYDDQPPLVPALARLTDQLSGGSLVALRLPTALVVAVTVLLVGLLARELGGGRGAQLLAAALWASSGVVLVSGHLLSTTPYDILCWTAIAWPAARWVRTRDDRLLLALGPVAGLGLLAKNLPLLFIAALAGAILIAGPREMLRRPALWVAAAVATAIWAPNLWWQATHDWPQLTMAGAIRRDADYGGRIGLLPSQFLIMSPPLALIWIPGLWRLLRNPQARPYRFLGVAFLLVLGLVLVTGGREYYPAGAYPALFAAGSVAAAAWAKRAAFRLRRALLVALVVVNAAMNIAIALPVYPVRWFPGTIQAAFNDDAAETIGWPELVDTVAAVYRSLPAEEQATAVIITTNYGEAGAIDKYGPARGLPAPYSGHLNFWRWGPPPDTATGPAIFVGDWTAGALASYCGSATIAARVDNGYGVDNEEQGTPVWLCRDVRGAWSGLWPGLRRFG
ncbi:glycosyltransferase family 39 protein [Actinoplanes sp. NPDC026623]|uniref:ArnT family glycosyltransferase n=1 Tax=Actinoplanes sp. NPDC026623 TaxID=3155610 RepID=UPI0033D98232